MSADANEVAPVEAGPVVITVQGQEAPTTEAEAPAPVVAPVAKEAAGSEESETGEDRDEKGRFKPGVQHRIDELTRARREAEREAEYWRVRAQGSTQEPAKAAKPDANTAPARANYATDEAYLDALADHKVEQRLSQRDAQARAVAEQTTKAESWSAKLVAARAEVEGFDDVMNSSETPVAAHVAELIMEHDHGAKVAHYFAANPAELEKINAMPPIKAASEIAKIGHKFEPAPGTDSSSKPAAERITKAPPPATRTVGSGRATTPNLGDLSMEDYIAQRKAQGASWAR